MTPIQGEYYFDVIPSGYGFLELRLYRRRPNHKWWQREYIRVSKQTFLADSEPKDVALSTLERHVEYQKYRNLYNQNLAKYQTKTRIMP
jgi:hypothetical protein